MHIYGRASAKGKRVQVKLQFIFFSKRHAIYLLVIGSPLLSHHFSHQISLQFAISLYLGWASPPCQMVIGWMLNNFYDF